MRLCDTCTTEIEKCIALKPQTLNRKEECLKIPAIEGHNKEDFFNGSKN